ncbi:hypothetical protein RFF05_13935 [Bengtsoniella intestinalis]|uniref:hypothetical protein n=1 Tax=Bengtsoniella intestinalis TaxID=3073143 RepID=UPI00391F13FD
MCDDFDTKILISSPRGEMVVEQLDKLGIVSRKNIDPAELRSCFLHSYVEDGIYLSGLLPENCIAVNMSEQYRYYFLSHQRQRADITYEGTLYENFPLPRLVFGFQFDTKEQRVRKCKLCVVPEGVLTSNTKLYYYPFSNVGTEGSICLGNNPLPVYKRSEQLTTLPGFILSLPNNNHQFMEKHNKPHLQYRDLLEHMKDKPSAYYYEHILIENGQTLGQFLEWR